MLEYRTISIYTNYRDNCKELTKETVEKIKNAKKEGWELMSASDAENCEYVYLYFKRQKKEE